MNIPLTLLVVYSAALVVVGLWIARLVRGSGEFFVAGRQLPASLIFATVLAANIGASSTVGATGLAYREGLSGWWWNGSAAIGSLALAFWIGPRIWSLAARHGFYTTGDFLEHRYSRMVRGVVAALLWAGTLAILAAQLIAGAAVLDVVAGLSRPAGAAIGGLVMTIYFVAGGLLSSVWVNAVQLVVLLGGFLVAAPMLYTGVGGSAAIAASDVPSTYWSVWYSSGAANSGWANLFLLAPAFIISPGLLQKAYGARSAGAVRRGVGWQAVALMAFACFPVFFGVAARAAHPGISDPNVVLPTILAQDLPVWMGALALAAIFSAEVSTCDAILFMLATSLSKDLYKGFVNPDADDRRLLFVARLAAVAGGVAGVVLAIVLQTVIQAATVFYSVLGVSLFVPVVGGLMTRRAGPTEALASIVAGTATLLGVWWWTAGRGYGVWNPNILGLLAAAAAYAGVMMVRRS
ncbi:MAG TPA: sodium:solute symporter family protein [Vicinamibacterales bacterium]|nr:sodium:solute symporter family protein [Vicinamibacterales bacterium]